MTIKAFLSCSFDPNDAILVEKFKEILSELGINSYVAENVPDIFTDILDAIKEHELFISILTPSKANKPSEYISFELMRHLLQKEKQ